MPDTLSAQIHGLMMGRYREQIGAPSKDAVLECPPVATQCPALDGHGTPITEVTG